MARYVGRERQLATIEAALADAMSGSGRIVVLSGEAGIGKTRLLIEIERHARHVPVLWGRAPEAEGVPPYWPWRQVLHAAEAVRDDPATRRDSTTSEEAALVSRIVTPVVDQASATTTAGLEAGDARFRMFDAVSGYLRETARDRGMVVLLDDLHWADAPSLRLLEHVAQEWSGTRALLVCAHRTLALPRDAPLRHTVAQLSRLEAATRLELTAFTYDEVAARLTDLVGRQLSDEAVRGLYDRTNGNPFFVTEFGHLIRTDPGRQDQLIRAEWDVPQGVRDVIARLVSRLSPACQEVLEVASVAGASPSPTLVAAVMETSLAAVLELFDEAASVGLLTRANDRIEYTFTHALVRDALYSELPASQRVQWHGRIARELERAGGIDRHERLSQLAYHWLQSTPAGHAEHAAAVAAEAADAAMTQLAYEEAARLYEAAADAQPAADAGPRSRLLLQAARARFRAGELARSVALCEETARAARHSSDAQLIAEAALVVQGVGDPDVSRVIAGLCEEALVGLPGDAVRTRGRLLSQLTSTKLYLGDYALLEPLSREALDIAEKTGDHDTLVEALRARHMARSDAAGLEERILLADRLLDIARGARNLIDEFWARLWRFDIDMQQGRLDDADMEVAAIEVLADRLHLPLAQWHLERIRFALAHSRGEFAAALRAAHAGDTHARAAGMLAGYRAAMQEVILSVLTGADTGAADAALHELDASAPTARMAAWIMLHRLTRSMIELSRGNAESAAALFDGTPRPPGWSVSPPALLVATAHRAVLAAALGRRDESALLYQLLLPFADLFASSGDGAVACFGSVERPLGVLARSLGRVDTAVRHLERAVGRDDGAGMHPWAAESRFELARTLQMRHRDGDVARALATATESRAAAERMGMRPLVERSTALHDALRAGTRQARVLTPREMEIARMVAEGLTSREIAAAMHISNRTADNHVQHILDKLQLRSRSQIATWVARH